MRTASTWPPVMPRHPIPLVDEDGIAIPSEQCYYHENRLAVWDVPIGDMTGQQWHAVCEQCADQINDERVF